MVMEQDLHLDIKSEAAKASGISSEESRAEQTTDSKQNLKVSGTIDGTFLSELIFVTWQ